MLHIHLCFRCTRNFSPLPNLSTLYTSTLCLGYSWLREGSVPVQSQKVNVNHKWTKMLQNISQLGFTLHNSFRGMSFSDRRVRAWATQTERPRAGYSGSTGASSARARARRVSRQTKSILSRSTHTAAPTFSPAEKSGLNSGPLSNSRQYSGRNGSTLTAKFRQLLPLYQESLTFIPKTLDFHFFTTIQLWTFRMKLLRLSSVSDWSVLYNYIPRSTWFVSCIIPLNSYLESIYI